MKYLFILGAGASVESGAPVMSNFLDTSESILASKRHSVNPEAFESVFALISSLHSAYAKSHVDLDNIENLMGLIEMGQVINRLSNYRDQDILKIRESMFDLIVDTLENSISFPTNKMSVRPTESYDKFGKLLNDMSGDPFSFNSAVITFNYDIALDIAISYGTNVNVEYFINNEDPSKYPLLKLHGSLNWGKCKNCSRIHPLQATKYLDFINSNLRRNRSEGPSKINLPISKYLPNIACCGEPLSEIPVIVPPTWNKTDYHGAISRVWENAASYLAKAENIFVIGYSLPESDAFFRYLFALGLIGPTRIKRFWVFDPNDTGEVELRYKAILGRGIANRFAYHELPFSKAIELIRDELKITVRRQQ